MTSDKKTRWQYSSALKEQVLAECGEPGASVAKVAMAHGINANVGDCWKQLSQDEAHTGLAKTSEFIAIPLPTLAVPAAVAADVRVELRRGPVSITVIWLVSAAAELAAWTR